MGSTGEKINYSLRPAKQIERKMLCIAFQRLSHFAALSSYRYIGFGSFYFHDFMLFHKALGIENMISIERDVVNEARFRFNVPFSCVDLLFGSSNSILPDLPWDVRTILWLDYDYMVDKSVLTDISWFIANSMPSSILVITVNAQPDLLIKTPVENLTQRVSVDKMIPNVKKKDMSGWGIANISRKIINNHLLEELAARNGSRPSGSKFVYQQLFNFHYQDGAKMLTVGGILYDEGQQGQFDGCRFDNLDFIKNDEEPYTIEIPKLTFRELRHLDQQLPTEDFRQLKAQIIPERDLERYSKVYPYFPTFAEIYM